MNKIREIIEKHSRGRCFSVMSNERKRQSSDKEITGNSFDKLEEDLQELFNLAVKENRKKRFNTVSDVIGI